jgi:hypothetical protein
MTSPGAFRFFSGSVEWSYLGSVEWSFMVVIKCYSVTIMIVIH